MDAESVDVGDGHIPEDQVELTIGREYRVHALSVWRSRLYLLVVDDLEMPAWREISFFEMVSASQPNDWVCNAVNYNDILLLVGPPFIAKDIDCYRSMVELEPASVSAFWKDVHARVG